MTRSCASSWCSWCLIAVLALGFTPARAQDEDSEGQDDRSARFSPAAMVERILAQAGRSAIPQPGEGFPKALSFATDAPLSVPFTPEGVVVPWHRAAEYVGGDVITVQGRVVDAFEVPNGPCLLKFDAKDRNAFCIAAFTDGWPTSKGSPEALYRGRTIRVTGAVTAYKGNPQIVVKDPGQIEIARP